MSGSGEWHFCTIECEKNWNWKLQMDTDKMI